MLHAPQGLHAFFRAYYHYKSADWKGNKPHPLKARIAEEMAQIPTYYVMERDKGMAETVAPMMPSAAEIAACKWLTEPECEVYGMEYARSGWTGALQEYRIRRNNAFRPTIDEQLTYSGRTIDVPTQFIAGTQDWGANRGPGGAMGAQMPQTPDDAVQLALQGQWLGPQDHARARRLIEERFSELFVARPEGFRPLWRQEAREMLITWETNPRR